MFPENVIFGKFTEDEFWFEVTEIVDGRVKIPSVGNCGPKKTCPPDWYNKNSFNV